jgi:hypothetical protein
MLSNVARRTTFMKAEAGKAGGSPFIMRERLAMWFPVAGRTE